MVILISCSKLMNEEKKLETSFHTSPVFYNESRDVLSDFSQYSVNELAEKLKINTQIAADVYLKYQRNLSGDAPKLPAISAYSGIVFKRINPYDFTLDDLEYAQSNLLITSFCYGLLRPLDLISSYRLEGAVKYVSKGNISLFSYWKTVLTDYLISYVKERGGTLLNLASNEMKKLFDWKKVERELNVISPEFHCWKGDKLKTIVVYTKMSRGEMTRYVLKNRINDFDELKAFSWEGLEYNPSLSTKNPIFVV